MKPVSQGTIHTLPPSFKEALIASADALQAWESITPLARNEWICWIISPKLPKTRDEHHVRAIKELREGIRRPCCWIGCTHRTDKKISPSVQGILSKRK